MINLAGVENCDEQIRRELGAAGIEVRCAGTVLGGEVPYKCFGQLGHWSFRRAWYYWIADGPGIPPDDAMRLYEAHGAAVRVDGHCGRPSPIDWFGGFAVGLYHVDSQEGLNALAATIREIMARHPEAEAWKTARGGVRGLMFVNGG